MHCVKQELDDATSLTASFVFILGHCVNFKTMRYELTGLNRIVADKLHSVQFQVKI